MVSSDARTPDELIAALPPDRREAMTRVRELVNANLPTGFEEGIEFGMIAWYVPLERFPDTYNGHPLGLAALASQKQYMSLYLNAVYSDPETEQWFRGCWVRTGKKLDMGKSCVRFRRLDDLPLELIAATVARTSIDDFVERYRAVRGSSRKARAAATMEG
jgi:hypothetical protein